MSASRVYRRSLIVTVTIIATSAIALTSSLGSTSIVRGRIYRPDPMPAQPTWPDLPSPETISVTTSDGLVLQGYRWRADQPRHVTVVVFHGNGGNRYSAARLAAPLPRSGVEIVIASYRGYGGNPGTPNEQGLYRDGAAFLAFARASRPERLYVFGFSLGGAVALHLAGETRVDGIITLGAFSSLDSVAPPLARAILPDHFDNIAAVRRVSAPMLMLHGTADTVVPFTEGEKLKAAAEGKARFLHLEGAPHDVRLDQLADRIWREIEQMPVVDRTAKK